MLYRATDLKLTPKPAPRELDLRRVIKIIPPHWILGVDTWQQHKGLWGCKISKLISDSQIRQSNLREDVTSIQTEGCLTVD